MHSTRLYPPVPQQQESIDTSSFVKRSKYYSAKSAGDGTYDICLAENDSECVDINSLPQNVQKALHELEALRDQLPKNVPDSQATNSSRTTTPTTIVDVTSESPNTAQKRPRDEGEKKKEEPAFKATQLVETQLVETQPIPTHHTNTPIANTPTIEDADSEEGSQPPAKRQKTEEVSQAFATTVNTPDMLPPPGPTRTFSRSLTQIVSAITVQRASGTSDVRYQVRRANQDEIPSDLSDLPSDVIAEINELDAQETNQ